VDGVPAGAKAKSTACEETLQGTTLPSSRETKNIEGDPPSLLRAPFLVVAGAPARGAVLQLLRALLRALRPRSCPTVVAGAPAPPRSGRVRTDTVARAAGKGRTLVPNDVGVVLASPARIEGRQAFRFHRRSSSKSVLN